MDSYIVTIIDVQTNEVHIMAEWECSKTELELRTKAAATISRMVQKIGSTNVVIDLQLVNA